MSIATVFQSIMSWIGKEEKIVYADIVKYAPPIAKIAELIFPSFAVQIAAGETTVLDATGLIQNAVLMVEQKYAASGAATGTGAQKSAEVLTLAGPVVLTLLKQAGVTADTTYIQSLITAVVSILNITQAPAPPATA